MAEMTDLTPRQRRILDFIAHTVLDRGYPPTVREIGEAAGILDGDLVVVRRQESAGNGDVVAALLPGVAEEEATIKRLRRQGGKVTLHPENPAFSPIPMTDGRILGKVVAVLRKL